MELRSGRRLRSWPPPQAGRRRPTRSQGSSAGDGEDRIGALPDDLLLLVISRLGCPRVAARTGILSSRWRGLWTRIPRVTVTLHRIELGDLEAALARAACAGLHLLDITVAYGYGHGEVTAFQVAAALAAVDRLSPVELCFSIWPKIRCSSSGVYLPRFSRATSIEIKGIRDLTRAASGLPALERLTLVSYEDLRLGNLIPICPCLRVLLLDLDIRLDYPSRSMVAVDLRIHSTSLEELHVKSFKRYTNTMDIVVPMLKQLKLSVFTSKPYETIAISIWAPVMEKFSWCWRYGNTGVGIGGTTLWRLSHLELTAVQRRPQGTIPYNGEDDTCLYLPIFPTMETHSPPPAWWDLAEEIRKITNTFPAVEFSTLKLDVDGTRHVFGPLVLILLGINWIRKGTRRLQIVLKRRNNEQCCAQGTNCPCDQPANWRTKPTATLINLEQVQVEGFQGLDDEFDFLKLVFKFALMLKKVYVKVSDNVTATALKNIDNMFKEYPGVECSVTSAPVGASSDQA